MFRALQQTHTNLLSMRCLEERHEVLLKADSVADFKNMFQDAYIDTRLTLTETVNLFVVADFEHGLIC